MNCSGVTGQGLLIVEISSLPLRQALYYPIRFDNLEKSDERAALFRAEITRGCATRIDFTTRMTILHEFEIHQDEIAMTRMC